MNRQQVFASIAAAGLTVGLSLGAHGGSPEKFEFFKLDASALDMGSVTYPGAPAKLNGSPWQAGRAPLLGEHNNEIYGALDITETELTDLKTKGVI